MDEKSKTPAYDALGRREKRLVDEYLSNGMVQWRAYRDTIYSGKTPTYGNLSTQATQKFTNNDISAAIQERLAENRMSADEVLARLQDQASGSGGTFTSFRRVQVQSPKWVPVEEAIIEAQFEVDVERDTQMRLEVEDDETLDELERRVARLQVIAERDPGRLIKVDGPVKEVEVPYVDVSKMRDEQKLHLLKSLKEDKDGSVRVELYDAQSALKLIGQRHGLFGAKGTEDDPLHHTGTITINVVNKPQRLDTERLDDEVAPRPLIGAGDGR